METAQTISEFESDNGIYAGHLPLKTFLYSALGLGTIFYYVQFGAPLVTQYYFSGVAIPNLHLAIISLLVILTLTAIGCSVHVKILGGFEKTDVQREIKKEIGKLRTVYATASTRIAELDAEIFDRHAQLSPRGLEALRTLKKVATALDKRIQTTAILAKSEKLPELFRAVEILRKKLNTSESATTSLIDVDPIPAIEPNQIEAVVANLSAEIEVLNPNRLAA